MPKLAQVRATLGAACSGLGTLWAAVGALKLIFGIRVTFPLFPPIDLERVAAWPAVAAGLVLVFLGAWLQRDSAAEARHSSPISADDEALPLLNAGRSEPPMVVDRRDPAPIYRTPTA